MKKADHIICRRVCTVALLLSVMPAVSLLSSCSRGDDTEKLLGRLDSALEMHRSYDKYFKDGDVQRNTLTEFNSSNTRLLSVEEVKNKLLELEYVRQVLAAWDRL